MFVENTVLPQCAHTPWTARALLQPVRDVVPASVETPKFNICNLMFLDDLNVQLLELLKKESDDTDEQSCCFASPPVPPGVHGQG